MSEAPKTRRTYTPEERIARLRSQEEMILKRALEKKRERVTEALGLISEIEAPEGGPMDEAQRGLSRWLEETKP